MDERIAPSGNQSRRPVALAYMLAAAGCGALLGVTHRFPILAPLQIAALAGFVVVRLRANEGWKASMWSGLLFGLGYVGVRIIGVGLPLPVWVVLVAIGVGYFASVGALWGPLAKASPLVMAAGFGGACCLLEWLQVTYVPLFGTSQTFVLPWSAWPGMIGFISITGLLGLTFFLGWCSALLALLISRPQARRVGLVAILASLTIVGAINFSQSLKVGRLLKVAIVGYASPLVVEDTGALFADFTAAAADRSAELIVFPEMSAVVQSEGQRELLLSQLQSLSTQHDCIISMSYFDYTRGGNFAVLITPDGQRHREHQKTHLVPGMENYHRGDGDAVIVEYGGATFSTMICQDDNFTDISRTASHAGVDLVTVPTLDWEGVHQTHFQNSILRAIEGNYAIARASSGGISAIVNPGGRVVGHFNHFVDRTNPRMIVHSVFLTGGETLYARLGDWPIVLLAVACLILAIGRSVSAEGWVSRKA